MKLTPKEFTTTYYPFAKTCEDNTGISAVFTLAQAALESGWGEHAPGNMFFGVKASKNMPEEKRQLLVTTEYVRKESDKNKFPEVLSCTKVGSMYKLKVKDWFRRYISPGECFEDHARLLMSTPRYAEAMKVKSNPYRLCDEIAKAGYATAPDYASVLKQICRMIQRNI